VVVVWLVCVAILRPSCVGTMDTTVVSVLSSHNGHVLNINQYLCSLSSFHMNILFQGKYNSVYSFLTWWFIFPRSNSLFPASIFHHSYSCFNSQFTLPIISYPSAEISLLRHLFQFCTINNNFTAYIPSFC